MQMGKKTREERIIMTAAGRRHIDTQKELAKRSGIEKATVSNNFKHPHSMNLPKLHIYAVTAGMTAEEIGELVLGYKP